VAWAPTTVAGTAYAKHPPPSGGKIANYVEYGQSNNLQYHFLSTIPPPLPRSSAVKIAKFEIIANQLHTLTRHYTLLVYITLLLLAGTSAQMEMYNNKANFFA
jgi:hypothetical protein